MINDTVQLRWVRMTKPESGQLWVWCRGWRGGSNAEPICLATYGMQNTASNIHNTEYAVADDRVQSANLLLLATGVKTRCVTSIIAMLQGGT